MGWFWVTDSWLIPTGAEETQWAIRLDWCCEGDAWWTAVHAARTTNESYPLPPSTWSFQPAHTAYQPSPSACFSRDTLTRLDTLVVEPLRDLTRMSPSVAQLRLWPQLDTALEYSKNPDGYESSLWKGFICNFCRKASSRKSWAGWFCECGYSVIPNRKIWQPKDLKSSMRLTSTGPRIDCGYPSFPDDTYMEQNVWSDGIKTVSHRMTNGSSVHQVLAHREQGQNVLADGILFAIQSTQAGGLPLQRPTAIELSYTCSVRDWTVTTPQICFDAINLINDRAGRILLEEQE
jgi:hypothetical protein